MQNETRHPSSACGARAAPILLVSLFLLTVPCLGQSARKPAAFAEGIKAIDAQEWSKSIELLHKAMKEQEEDGAWTRIYGTRYQEYLPHFFLGFALYRQGKENCQEALKQWDLSESAGHIQRTRKYSDLVRYRAECQRQLSTPPQTGQPARTAPSSPPPL